MQTNPVIEPPKTPDRILCCYINNTAQTQIVRITENSSYLERVIVAGGQIVFEAVADAYLEIHTLEMVTAILADKIVCSQLLMKSLE